MAKSKSRKKIVLISLLALVGIAAGAYFKFGKRVPPIAISEEKVARRNITEEVVANGKIEPVQDVNISPEVSGEIIDLEIKEGDHVKKGDLLLKIRPDNYVAARDSAKANFNYAVANKETAAANLEKASLEYDRNQALFKSKLISDSDFLTAKNLKDVAISTLAAAVEQVSIAQANLVSAEADLSKTVIYSPLDGTISQLNSHLGERVVGTATMAGTVIMVVANLTNMEARVDVGEMDVPLIALCQKARLEVDSFKDQKFGGLVTEIANSANNNDFSSSTASTSSSTTTSTDATKFQVKIHVAEREHFLPGMSVTANIETRYHSNVLSIPIQCVTTRLPVIATNAPATNEVAKTAATNTPATNVVAKAATDVPATNVAAADPPSAESKKGDAPKPIEVVFVVDGDHVKQVAVKRGIGDDNYVEIVEGLKEGDEVVSGGYKAINHDLSDGTKIVINKEAAGQDKGPKVN